MSSLRPHTAYIDFVFNQGDTGHPLLQALAHLESERTVGVESGNGYSGRPRVDAIKRRYAYDRDIISAIEQLGGFWPDETDEAQWTQLGDVDVVFLDKKGRMLGATVTHEGMIITPNHKD